jgi:hypothetical protein
VIPVARKLWLPSVVSIPAAAEAKGPLFRTIGRGTGKRTRTVLPQANVAQARGVEIGGEIFLEHLQEMAAHESPRTTKLNDRTKEQLTQDEVERITL